MTLYAQYLRELMGDTPVFAQLLSIAHRVKVVVRIKRAEGRFLKWEIG